MPNSIIDSFIKEAIKTESVNFVDISRRLVDKRTIRLLHAGMGLVTEAAEFLDALKKWIFYGKAIDIVNLKEELGDSQWYTAIAMDELGTDYEEILALVIRKLRARYNKSSVFDKDNIFTEDAAIVRDLEEERKILEFGGYTDNFTHYSADKSILISPICQPKAGFYKISISAQNVDCPNCIRTIKVNYPKGK